MPIPEPGANRPSILYTSGPDGKIKPATREQREQEMAAVMGVSMSTPQLTVTEIEQMRRLVAQHDARPQNKIQVMDPNNPPKLPYTFQKFPLMVYDLEHSYPARQEEQTLRNGAREIVHIAAKVISMLVQSEEQLQRAIEDGWSQNPPEFREAPEERLNASFAVEAERVQEKLDSAKRGPGRPPKG